LAVPDRQSRDRGTSEQKCASGLTSAWTGLAGTQSSKPSGGSTLAVDHADTVTKSSQDGEMRSSSLRHPLLEFIRRIRMIRSKCNVLNECYAEFARVIGLVICVLYIQANSNQKFEKEDAMTSTLEGRPGSRGCLTLIEARREPASRLYVMKLLLHLRDITYTDDVGKTMLRAIFRKTSV
jgi:hypothetical protein